MAGLPNHNEFYQVLYEDNHLLIVNKEPGVLVQGDKTGDRPLIDLCKEYIKAKYDKPGDVFLGLVHRLDRPTSGITVLARTSKALERMTKIFRERKVQKYYWAIVKRRPKDLKGKLVDYLLKDERSNTVSVVDEKTPGAKRAELRYRVMGKLNDHWLLEVELLTGRPHQIRAQLSHIGSPIRGDVKYGFKHPDKDGNIHLHARRIYFEHPVKKEPLSVTAGVPRTDFWEQYLVLDDVKVKDKDVDKLY